MQQSDAHPLCGDIVEMPLDWRPPETSKSPLYAKHSIFKSHVELVGPDGLVKSESIRLGLYGMLVILGPIWVFLFLDETASVNTLIGGAIVLFAIAGNALAGARRKPPMID